MAKEKVTLSKVSPLLNNFSAGELSPRCDARADIPKYKSGCIKLENFVPLITGGVRRVPGTEYVNYLKGYGLPDLGPFTLTITKSGDGTGTVTSDVGGINCGVVCQANFAYGTTVVLTAAPDEGSIFKEWSGDASGDLVNATVIMNNNKLVNAEFVLMELYHDAPEVGLYQNLAEADWCRWGGGDWLFDPPPEEKQSITVAAISIFFGSTWGDVSDKYLTVGLYFPDELDDTRIGQLIKETVQVRGDNNWDGAWVNFYFPQNDVEFLPVLLPGRYFIVVGATERRMPGDPPWAFTFYSSVFFDLGGELGISLWQYSDVPDDNKKLSWHYSPRDLKAKIWKKPD
jgi:hypothetical protein